MLDPITFIVDAEPVPKQSFRVLKGGGGYRSPRVEAWQRLVSWQAKIAMDGREPMKGTVSMRVIFCLGNNRRVDLDNLNKGVSDAMSGIVFEDDRQVVNLHLVKHVKKHPGILVQVYPGELLPPFVEGK